MLHCRVLFSEERSVRCAVSSALSLITASAILASSCSRAPHEPPAAPGVIHLAERAAAALAERTEGAAGSIRTGLAWTFPADSAGWSAVAGEVSAADSSIVLSGGRKGAVLAGPRGCALRVGDVAEIEVRAELSDGEYFGVYWDPPDGEHARRVVAGLSRSVPGGATRSHGTRIRAAAGRMQVYRIAVPAAWDVDGEIDRVLLSAEWDGPSGALRVESLRIVTREELAASRTGGALRRAFGGIEAASVAFPAGMDASFSVRLPESGRLRFLVANEGRIPPGLRITAALPGAPAVVLHEGVPARPRAWEAAGADLAQFGGREIALVVTAGEGDGFVYWGAPVIAHGAGTLPPLVLYEIDTLRSDLLEPYGYPGRTSPALGAFSRRAVLFRECISASSWTRPAAASILTSRSGPAHGVQHEHATLPASIPTLAEVLRERGYFTVAFVTNPNAGRAAGLERGFDVVFEPGALFDRWRAVSPGGRIPSGWTRSDPSGTSEAIHTTFRDWIADRTDAPLFLYIHPNDPHAPYRPRAPFAAIPGMTRGDSSLRGTRAFARYARDIRAADHFFGRILAELEAQGVLNRAGVVVVADHGEEFREHGKMGHGNGLWAETLRVPLLVRLPGGEGGVLRTDRVTSLDILPTFAELAGARLPAGVEGRSLLREGDDRPIFAHLIRLEDRLKPEVLADEAVRGEVAMYAGGAKVIVRDYAGHGPADTLLIRPDEDPGEQVNLAVEEPARAAEMARQAVEWLTTLRGAAEPAGDRPVALDPESLERLRALGYVQ
ncbi:MAG: sulfatase [Gemmatimonadota bacterium]|nr:sulfatase [Gemmatimonadota bacterium]MDP6803619.1 sulfatase [Gemmatimonadota bacterium]MDP6803683.1 sulfatase [Gemmatimonadota bacterium]MDP7032422.1 sulfatase [Gemmatimonadota bacterium]